MRLVKTQRFVDPAGIADAGQPRGGVEWREAGLIAGAIKRWRIPVSGTQSWMHAQVTAGGVSTGEIDPGTMESRLAPGLFFAGEVIDVDGDRGGFGLRGNAEFQQRPRDCFLALRENFPGLFGSQIEEVFVGEFSGHVDNLHAKKPKSSKKMKGK
jgi:hypothetical protein